MREELESLVSTGKIERRHVDPLLTLIQCGFCEHRGWGFGRIRQVDPVFGRFTIDFTNKPGHSMDLAFAAELLKAIPRDHILARKAEDLAGLRQMAALHHLDVIKLVLRSFGGKATVDQLQRALVPDVIATDWRKWWEAARQEMKRDGHFTVPLKKTEPIVYQEAEVSLQDRLMTDFRAARGLKARLVIAGELLKSIADLTDAKATATEAIATLNSEIASHQRTMPALALEAIFMRDDLRQAVGADAPAEGEMAATAIWAQVSDAGEVLEQVSGPKHKRALQSFRDANPLGWHGALLQGLNSLSAKLCAECASLLIEGDHWLALKDRVLRLVSQHAASSELLYWLAKERSTDQFADILGPEVFRAMLSAIERDQFNERKKHQLRDYIMDDSVLLVELIESADIEVIKDLTRALQLSPSFDDMDKRSLLARIVKHFPAVQSLISSEHTRQDNSLVVSWESLERRRQEYHELVEKKIPANSRDIAVARSYGDLRENHEYKAAKEQHRLLMLRKAELENQLLRARGTDFSDTRADAVGIGTSMRVLELGRQHRETLTILGAWDFDTTNHVVSYLSPLAQSLMGKKVGDETELELEGQTARYRIESIAVYQPTPPAVSQTIPATELVAAAVPETAPVQPVEVPPAPAPADSALAVATGETASSTTPTIASTPAPDSVAAASPEPGPAA